MISYLSELVPDAKPPHYIKNRKLTQKLKINQICTFLVSSFGFKGLLVPSTVGNQHVHKSLPVQKKNKPLPDDKKGMSGYQESSSLHQYQLKLHDF